MKKILLVLPLSAIIFAFTVTEKQTDKWVAPAEAKNIKNPIAENKKSSSAKNGAKIFKIRCVVCHGDLGKGDGPGGKALNPKPANLVSAAVQSQTDGEIFWKITNGKGAMIKWDGILKENERWDMVNYIRTLKAKK